MLYGSQWYDVKKGIFPWEAIQKNFFHKIWGIMGFHAIFMQIAASKCFSYKSYTIQPYLLFLKKSSNNYFYAQ